jgi:serine/threonine-protein kinase RsbW
MPTIETLSVPGTLPGVREAIEAFDRFARGHQLSSQAVGPFLMALDEILSNIVRHGCLAPDAAIDLRFSLDRGNVEIEVVDTAAPFNPLLAPAPDTRSALDHRRPGGLGIALVRQLMDETRYERRADRNRFVMTRRS